MKTLLLLSLVLLVAAPALGLTYDQNVTPDVIFGSGNLNGSFTVDTQNSVELGLRGKLRFDGSNQPQNIFNSDGSGNYTFNAGPAPSGFAWQPGSPTTPIWNFEWAVNVDTGTTGNKLSDFTFEMGLDFDPTAGTNYLVFDPITAGAAAPYWDHSIGDNSTTSASDVIAGDATTYQTYLQTYNVAQNSWNYEFFNDAPFDTFDPNDSGYYEIYLKAFQGGALVAQTNITIVVGGVVPDDATSWGSVKSLFR